MFYSNQHSHWFRAKAKTNQQGSDRQTNLDLHHCFCSILNILFFLRVLTSGNQAGSEGQGDVMKPSSSSSSKVPIPAQQKAQNTRHPHLERGSRETRLKTSERTADSKDVSDEYAIVNLSLLRLFIGKEMVEHSKFKCKKPRLMLEKNTRLISTSLRVYCESCNYKGTFSKMYYEKKTKSPGVNPSTLNTALAAALVGSSIGATGMRQIFLKIGIDPGSKTGLQNQINKASDLMVHLTNENMAEVRLYLKKHYGNHIEVSIDTRYNNAMFSGGGPSHGGTQSVTTIVENMSDENRVVGIVTANKLCTHCTKSALDGDIDTTNHKNCTANIAVETAIGDEGRHATTAAEELKADGFIVSSLTSDGDSKTLPSFRKIHGANVVGYKDPRHMAVNQEKSIKKANFSDGFFPDCNTKDKTHKRKSRFAKKLRSVCTKEFNSARSEHIKFAQNTNLFKEKLVASLSVTAEKIIDCFAGLCNSKCKSFCDVCPNGQKECYIFPMDINLNVTDDDRALLRTLIAKRLGKDAIEKTYRNHSTQKNESINKAINKTNPKSITSVRNLFGRVAAAILNVNTGFDGSTNKILSTLGHVTSGNIKRKTLDVGNMKRYMRMYHRRPTVKLRRFRRCSLKYKIHDRIKSQTELYKKHCDL